MKISDRIESLRSLLDTKGLRAYIIPSTDPHQSEYVPDYWKVREFMSGFSGSAGTLVVTQSSAGLWTDFRYYIQAEKALAGSGIELFRQGTPGVPSYESWLSRNMVSGSRAGICSEQVSTKKFRSLNKVLRKNDITLVGTEDLVSSLWEDRPALPHSPLYILGPEFCGSSSSDKLSVIQGMMKKKNSDYFLLSSLDDIAWVLNLRASDINHSPVFLSHLLIHASGCDLFVDQSRLDETVREYLDESAVSIFSYNEIGSRLKGIEEGRHVLLSLDGINRKLFASLPRNIEIQAERNMTEDLKAVKNSREIRSLKQAHLKDGAALVRFFCWLSGQKASALTEISAAAKINALRKEQSGFIENSFEPISAADEHSAMCHYAPDSDSDVPLSDNGIYLLDSGGQYIDGTTDITRTIATGKPTEQQIRDYTLVLKAHIALATARFPSGTVGIQLDAITRRPLWDYGMEFGHGTGHGVGFVLNVHEGPMSISKRLLDVAIIPGMLMSDEPGLYREGQYGIRIENLILCVKDSTGPFGEFYRFETISRMPYDLTLTDPALLDEKEKQWLNRYHEQVIQDLSPLLDEESRVWLEKAAGRL